MKIKPPADVTDVFCAKAKRQILNGVNLGSLPKYVASVRQFICPKAERQEQRLTDLHHAGLSTIQNLDAITPGRN
ncbi:hypothetical protein AEA09_01995 [Lysinibacillus contaminans]|uniref:Integrase n=1 Tax=Lysinibacillus contaminans TaxID=1293441 RepID=A0ABR5K5R3_9BACI|nr:hypothetical protein AEA09_01995 [Lysinibacillus contaminans]